MPQSSSTPKRANRWLEPATVGAFCGFLFFFGLAAVGLTGADEPRYAQVAREMLARHDWVTPVLYGKPWLEKPALYYWGAIVSYKIFGVSDWAARLPSAVAASAMVAGVFLFFRRLFRGDGVDGAAPQNSALDAALMTASSAAVIGFGNAASTDMLLAALFSLGMLAWVTGWLHRGASRRSRLWLAAFYAGMALGTLAKGPVAALLAALVMATFAVWQRDGRVIRWTLWWPGVLLYLLIAAPWYVAVQRANPQFAKEFFLQQNLARFGTNLYRHPQPFWYYVPVLLISLVPWTLYIIRTATAWRSAWARATPAEPIRQAPPEIQLARFFVSWGAVPVLFFSLSRSKLPGYILPAVPAWTMLLAVWLAKRPRTSEGGPRSLSRTFLMAGHSVLAAALVAAAVLAPSFARRIPISRTDAAAAAVALGVLSAGIFLTLRLRGERWLRFVTLAPVVVAFAYVVRIGAPVLDAVISSRQLEQRIARLAPVDAPVAVFHAHREVEYGLAFYLGHGISNYERGEAPAADHLVVAPAGSLALLAQAAGERRVSLVGSYEPQRLELFWISKRKLIGLIN